MLEILTIVIIVALVIIVEIKDKRDLKKHCTVSVKGKVTDVWSQREKVWTKNIIADGYGYHYRNVEYFKIEYDYGGKKYDFVCPVKLQVIKKHDEYLVLINPDNPEEAYIPKGIVKDHSTTVWSISLVFVITTILLLNLVLLFVI